VTLDDIAQEKFVSYPREDGIREITDRVCLQAGFRPNVVFESFDSSVIAHLVRDGVGVALMPESWWQGAPREHLIKLPIAN
ncbi:LysR family transcriptional regulator substrate-binding protein, partial [Shewanella sp. C31]|nr:LysR family transcriptional regulator substrate-binding protein [Shewanella electrica]